MSHLFTPTQMMRTCVVPVSQAMSCGGTYMGLPMVTLESVKRAYVNTTNLNSILVHKGSRAIPVDTNDAVEDVLAFILSGMSVGSDNALLKFAINSYSSTSNLTRRGFEDHFLGTTSTYSAFLKTVLLWKFEREGPESCYAYYEEALSEERCYLSTGTTSVCKSVDGDNLREYFIELGMELSLVYHFGLDDNKRLEIVERGAELVCESPHRIRWIVGDSARYSGPRKLFVRGMYVSTVLVYCIERYQSQSMFLKVCQVLWHEQSSNVCLSSLLDLICRTYREVPAQSFYPFLRYFRRAMVITSELYGVDLKCFLQAQTAYTDVISVMFEEEV